MRPNWPFLVKLFAALAIAAVAVHLTHRWQVRRQVGAFLHQADVARDAGEADREAKYLERYLISRPGDTDVRERYGRLLAKAAKTGRARLDAYLVLDDVLRRDPARDDLRRFVAEYAMANGLFPEAQGHLDVLLSRRPDDGELEGRYAECLRQDKKYEQAEGWYTRSIQHRPDLVDSYAGRAGLRRLALKKPQEADADIAEMLAKNPQNHRTHLLVAGYWRAFAHPKQPAEVVARAVAVAQRLVPDRSVPEPAAAAAGGGPLVAGHLQFEPTVADATAAAVAEAQRLAPDELAVILTAAEVAADRGKTRALEGRPDEAQAAYAESRRLLARGNELHPKAPAVYLATAALEADTGTPAAAVETVRRGLATAPDAPALVLALLDYQIRAGDPAGAGATLNKLMDGGLSPVHVDYYQARILILTEEWLQAAALLERVRQDTPDDPGLGRQANRLLGVCYEQLGEPDRRLAAYRRAVPVDPTDPLWVPAVLGVAETQAALGQTDAALATYHTLKDLAPGAWVQIARLELIRALEAPAEGRNWEPTERAVATAERLLPEATDVIILRADLLHWRGNPAEARKRLADLRARRPKEAAVWIALSYQDLRDGNPGQALATLDAAAAAAGDSAEVRLARARLWVELKAPDLPAKLAGLAAGGEALGPYQHRKLVRGLAVIAAGTGYWEVADPLWNLLAALQPYDLGVHLVRFDRGVVTGNEPAMAAVQADIRRVDGEAGQSTRLARALYLLWVAQNRKDLSGLPEALVLLDGLARERGGWARVALAQAVIYDLQRNNEAALAKFQQAVEDGETNPVALRRLMELLAARGRDAEAAAVLKRMPPAVASSLEVQRLAAEVSLRTDPKQAIGYASRAVPENSTDPRDHIWRGQILWAAGDRAGAEAPFRKAVELNPASLDGWLVLVQYLVGMGRPADAEKEVVAAAERVAPADRALFLALAYAALRQPARADEQFRRARTERPTDLRTAQAEAGYLFQSGRLADAREAFGRVIELQTATPDDKAFARQMIAICLAADGDYQTSRKALEALDLVGTNGLRAPPADETPTQRRARLYVLALQRDRASRLEAIRLLEEHPDALTPNDKFLLARLHAAVGAKARVRVVTEDLLRGSPDVPVYVAFYAGWLVRDRDYREAERWVNQLQKLQPDGLATAELRARVYAARKDFAAARSVLAPHADRPGAPVGRIAAVCEEAGLFDDAERLFRRFGEENKAARPDAVLALAGFYGRRGRTADALAICDAARAAVPLPVVGEAAVNVLYAAPTAAPADVARVAGWFEDGAARSQGAVRAVLLQLLASVRNLQGDYAAAATLYRQAMEANDKDALAMNNLAFLLTVREARHDEALALLGRARTVLGPHPTLLDTEALVRLNKGEADAARRLLEVVTAEEPSGPAYFHLAMAEQAAQRDLEARIAWQHATDLGLKRAELHPLERPAYDKLADLMK